MKPFAARGRIALVAALAVVLLAGCAAIANRAADRLARNLGAAVLDQDDPATVRDGLPAYLLLLDGLIEGDPGSPSLRLAAADLYAAYAGGFVADAERARRLSARALDHAATAHCLSRSPLCEARGLRYPDFVARVAQVQADDVHALFVLAQAWTGWIQARADDYLAIAEIPKAEALLGRVVALEPGHRDGTALLYLGVLNSLRPAAVGGKPEAGRAYFERAIQASGGRSLMARTLFAEYYARLVFDRELHDRLLSEVVAADPRAEGHTLSNVLAQQRARELLAGSDDYF